MKIEKITPHRLILTSLLECKNEEEKLSSLVSMILGQSKILDILVDAADDNVKKKILDKIVAKPIL